MKTWQVFCAVFCVTNHSLVIYLINYHKSYEIKLAGKRWCPLVVENADILKFTPEARLCNTESVCHTVLYCIHLKSLFHFTNLKVLCTVKVNLK